MFKKILKTFLLIISSVSTLAILLLVYFNFPVKNVESKAELGVTFSARYAQDIGLNWKEAYVATLDDLQAKRIRIPVYWDLAEEEEGKYDFSNVDWQLNEAQKRNAEVILVIGQKVPRWPECFIPQWASVSDQKRKESLLNFVEVSVNHFKNFPAVKYWQVENEPFLDFGVCPKPDFDLIDKEIEIVRENDSSKKIIITDSGELSFWISAAKRADIFGTTMYRDVVSARFGSIRYPIGPNFFKFKQLLIKLFAKQSNVIVVELQGEPWLSGWTIAFSLEDQLKSFDENKLKDNIQFAKNTGLSRMYLWGAEWWYYLKVQKDYPRVWETAKDIFAENN